MADGCRYLGVAAVGRRSLGAVAIRRRYPGANAVRRQGFRTRADGALHENAVNPAAELEADRLQGAGALEAAGQVQLDRGLVIGVADHRDELAAADLLASLDQCAEQQLADAAAGMVLVDVNRIFERKAVGRPGPIQAGVGIADHATVSFRRQVGKLAPDDVGPALAHFGHRGRHQFERGQPVQDMMAVDFGDGGDIAGLGRTDEVFRCFGFEVHQSSCAARTMVPPRRLSPAPAPSLHARRAWSLRPGASPSGARLPGCR